VWRREQTAIDAGTCFVILVYQYCQQIYTKIIAINFFCIIKFVATRVKAVLLLAKQTAALFIIDFYLMTFVQDIPCHVWINDQTFWR
jgi:hypothetical protein